MEPKILACILDNQDSFISLRENVFNLHAMAKFTVQGDIIFDEPINADTPIEMLISQALNCGILEIYRGYIDELGRIHIVDAPNLQQLLKVVLEANLTPEIHIRTVRRLNLIPVKVNSVDWDIKDTDNTKQKEKCKKVGIIQK